MSNRREEQTWRDGLRIILSHRRLFLLGASLFAIVALLVSHYVPLKYTALATFERRGDSALEKIGRHSESFGSIKLTLNYELIGRDAVEQVVDELKLTEDFPRGSDGELTYAGKRARETFISKLVKGLKINWRVRSNEVDLISVGLTHDDPVLVEKVPNTLVKHYVEMVSQRIVERLTASREFLAEQVAECTRELAKLNKKRVEFETKYGNMVAETPGDLLTRTQTLRADMETLRRQHKVARQKARRIRDIIKTAKASQLRPKLRELRDELVVSLTLGHMTDKHPTVQTLLKKIAQVERAIETGRGDDGMEIETPANTMAMQLAIAESEVEVLEQESERLARRLKACELLIANSAPIRQEYASIVLPIEEIEAKGKRWQARLTDVQMALAAEGANRRTQLSTVSLAKRPSCPFSPALWMVMVVAFGGGLILAYGLAFASEGMNRSITTAEGAAEYFGVPVHGVIEKIETPCQRAVRKLWHRLFAFVVSVILVAMLAVSTFSVVLRLRYPDEYKEWRSSPAGYAQAHAGRVYREEINPDLRGRLPSWVGGGSFDNQRSVSDRP